MMPESSTEHPADRGESQSRKLSGHEVLFPPLPYDIKERAERAGSDIHLQQFINTFTYRKQQAREQALADAFGANTDAIRELAGAIKQHTLDHLDYYLERFIAEAESKGTTVHIALDSDQARQTTVSIASEHKCQLCVKSKSMVTEEIQLVPALEMVGCETVETDLGEFVIQLDQDAPSHIVTPMIHKDRKDAARAFQRELGASYTEDPEELTRIARNYLRDKYRRADLGVSGANFLVAETGSIVLCSNEGNARFCTSVPKVHVAIVGIEKLVPRLEHLSVFLKVLARSSTGQPLTSYTHTITGPKRTEEHDGPEQVHVILVDNGRTELLKKSTRELLRCIRCGACLNVCPVYRKIGGHAYGSVYSGPIGAALTPLMRGLANYSDLPHASSLCGACYEACPVKIDIPRQLIRLRHEMVKNRVTGLADRLFYRFWGLSLCSVWSYRLGAWIQRRSLRRQAYQNGSLSSGDPYAARGWVKKARGMLGGWTSQRHLPTPTQNSFHQWWIQSRSKTDADPIDLD